MLGHSATKPTENTNGDIFQYTLGNWHHIRNSSQNDKHKMEFQTHHLNGTDIAELKAEGVIIRDVQNALDLIGNVYFQGFDCVIIHRHNLTDDFFDLKNKLAGEILQKFSNYRIRLAIVGNFSDFTGKSIRDFIFESNNGKQVNFLSSKVEALQSLSI